MDSPQEDTFRSLMDFFKGRRYGILASDQPNLIRADIGSYWSWSRENARGQVETLITERDGGSYINLHFNFVKEYLTGLAASSVGAIVLVMLGFIIGNNNVGSLSPSSSAGYWLFVYGAVAFGIILIFMATMGIEGSHVSITKKRVIDEINMFVQSLQARRVKAKK